MRGVLKGLYILGVLVWGEDLVVCILVGCMIGMCLSLVNSFKKRKKRVINDIN